MALAVTARQSGNTGETAAETLTTSSATPTADSLFLVCSAAQNDNHQIAPTFEDPSGGGLTYTQVDTVGEVPWDGSASFSLSAAMERATVGGSPSGFTVTVDHWSNSQTAYYGAVCLDITGHDATTPIVQSKTAGTTKSSGNSESGSVTLDTTPTTGNLVVVAFGAGADGGGGFATPTLGGQAMTAVTNQDASFTQVGVFSRVIDGTESDATITCTDLGDVVGNFTAIAVEIAVDAATATDLDGTDTTQAQTAAAAALTQTHELGADGTTQAQTATAAALTQTHELATDSATQSQSATAAALTQVHELQPVSAVQGQTATAAALTQVHELAATDAVQAQVADTAAVAEGVTLGPASAVQAQVAGTAALTQVHELTAVDVLQAQSADVAVLTQLHELVAASAAQAQVVDLPALTLGVLTTPPERTLVVHAENRTLVVGAESRIRIIAAESRKLVVV